MRKSIPLVLIGSGLYLLAGGFLYDVSFAGIPYQDPTPEMKSTYAHHAGIAFAIMRIGIFTLVLGLLGLCLVSVLKKKAA